MQIDVGSVIGSFVILALIVFLVKAFKEGTRLENLRTEAWLMAMKKASEDEEAKKLEKVKKLKEEEDSRTYWRTRHEAEEKELNSRFLSAIDRNIDALKLIYKQSVHNDNFGNPVLTKWKKEMNNFIKSTILGENSRIELADFHRIVWDAHGVIYRKTLHALNNEPKNSSVVNSEDMTPLEFEVHCFDLLKASGWTTNLTKKTGDQGVDIIGFFGKTKAVFQCKFYSKPVGNKAVQEISSGREHEKADLAFVISNKGFTRAAKELASTNSVHLIHFSELTSISKKFAL